jgi:hypothetical protein
MRIKPSSRIELKEKYSLGLKHLTFIKALKFNARHEPKASASHAKITSVNNSQE